MLETGLAVLGALIVGFGAGYVFLKSRFDQQDRVRELEEALEQSRTEHADYKREVFEQFGETAEKFRALNQSYDDLHQQLARSAVLLCGDAAMPLLDAPEQEAIEVADDVETDPIEVTEEPDVAAVEESEAAAADVAPEQSAVPAEADALAEPSDPILVGEQEPPILSDVQLDDTVEVVLSENDPEPDQVDSAEPEQDTEQKPEQEAVELKRQA